MPAKTKKDFAGKTKTSKTYDKDWVFSNKQGAWITKDRAREEHQNQVEKHQAVRAAQAGPPVPTVGGAPSVAPINTAGLFAPTSVPVPGSTPTSDQPAWWINQAYVNPNPEQAFANAANAILPTLSPEDQRNLGNYLATNYKDVFGGYSQAPFGPIPTQVGETERAQYLNANRATQALSLLDRMQQASGGQMGPGYDFLKNAVSLITKYVGSGPMTREQYDQFSQAVAAFSEGANSDQRAYANLAQLFNLPSFSAGPLVTTAPSKKLYS